MPDPVVGTSGTKQIRADLGAGELKPVPVQHQEPDYVELQPANKPIGYPQPPDDLKFSEAVKLEVAQAAIPFHEAIDRLSQQIEELQHHNAAQHQHIEQLQSTISRNRAAHGESPGIMNKLSWAVKNCFVKPVAGLVCVALVFGAVALLMTPVAIPAVFALGAVLNAAVPLLIGGALALAMVHQIKADDRPAVQSNEDDPNEDWENPSDEPDAGPPPKNNQQPAVGFPIDNPPHKHSPTPSENGDPQNDPNDPRYRKSMEF